MSAGRPTKSHEYLFLLTKRPRYFFDAEAVKEANTAGTIDRLKSGPVQSPSENPKNAAIGRWGGKGEYAEANGRNIRSVWTISTAPFAQAHFATFPPSLVEPCIKAGSKPGDTILDPFGGAGTVSLVAERLGRDSIYIDLSETYTEMARKRIYNDAPLLTAIV